MRRRPVNARKDRKMFSRTAAKQHPRNRVVRSMRGGIRL